MHVWRCLVIFVLLHIGVSGITLPQCTGTTPQAIELIEGMPGQTIICDDTGQSDEVFWLTVSAGTATIVTQCASPNSACTNPGPVFTATRNSTSSTMTVTSSITRKFARIEMRCRVVSSVITCPLDVVYPSEATCVAQYNTGSPQWTVSGSCTITKASSERGRYNCSWLYTHNSNGAIQIAYDQTSNSSISQIPGSNATHPYFSFTCNFRMPFPSVAGTYGYSTVLYPGNVKKTATFSGSSVVVDPTTPSHDCPPGAVTEGTTITCNCTITSLGSPPGTLAWKGQSGPQLHLINVRLSQNNQLYTCELRRGTMVIKETKYTLQVAAVAMTQSDNSGAIAGGILGGVLLVAVGVVAVLVFKKKKGTPTKSGRRNDNTPDTGDLTNTSPAITDFQGRRMKLGVSADNSAAVPINSSSSSVESSADD